MLDDLDKTLKTLLESELSGDIVDQVSISFATPNQEFPPPSVHLPAINLFLYDVRENRELRNNEWVIGRGSGAPSRKGPPLRIDCSYLITVWPSQSAPDQTQDEHRLLGEVLKALGRHPRIPAQVLQNSLQGQEPDLPISALQPGRLQSVGEFWQALGGTPKAALNYTVTMSVDLSETVETESLVIDKEQRIEQRTQGGG